MADVVVAGPRRGAGQHGKHRCGAIERLDLGLLVHAQHQRPLGGIQVQPDDVADLGHEQRILGQLPRILFVRSQSERPPDPRHHRLRQPKVLGHRPRRPVRRIRGCGLQRGNDQRLDPVIADHPRPTRPRLIDQPVQPYFGEAVVWEEEAATKFLTPANAPMLRKLLERFVSLSGFSKPVWEEQFKRLVEEEGMKMGQLAQPVRVALTGRTASPGLFDVMEVLGRERTLSRLRQSLARAETAHA